jgi:hypothetical protein
MASALLLNAAAITVVVGGWAAALIGVYRKLGREERQAHEGSARKAWLEPSSCPVCPRVGEMTSAAPHQVAVSLLASSSGSSHPTIS